MNKEIFRKKILEKRQSMSKNDVMSKSIIIIKSLMSTDFYNSSQAIMTYVSFRNEVRTIDLINQALNNKRVIIPKTIPETKEIELSELRDLERDLDTGVYGVLEPKKDFIRPVSNDIIDLVIVPGAAFDLKGNRIGYGAGYYDKFLSKLDKSIPKIALAFDFQIMENVHSHEYDVPMDYIITENRIIKCMR